VATSYSIRILLQDTGLFGGVKVVLLHADNLSRLGYEVTVVSTAPSPDWYPLKAPFLQVEDLACRSLPHVDVVVATYWETIAPAMQNDCTEVVHFCQGFEWLFSSNLSRRPEILEAYRLPLPAFVVSPHLGQRLDQDFGRPSKLVLQPLETFWRPSVRQRLFNRPAVRHFASSFPDPGRETGRASRPPSMPSRRSGASQKHQKSVSFVSRNSRWAPRSKDSWNRTSISIT